MSARPPSSPALPFKQRVLHAYLALARARPGALLLALGLLTVALGALVPRLEVDPRLEALLPPHTITSAANEEAKRRFAGISPYYLVVQSSDPDLNRRIAEEALERVKQWPETLWAIQRRDPSYFLDRRLLYVDKEILEELSEDVEIYLDWHRCAVMPGCVNLEDEPPEPDFERIRTHYETVPDLAALTRLFGKGKLPEPEAPSDAPDADGAPPNAPDADSPARGAAEDPGVLQRASTSSSGGAPPSGTPPDRFGELCRDDGGACVVQAVLDGDASNMEFATAMLHRGEALLESLAPDDKPDDLITAVTGVYRNLPLTREAVMRDLRRTFGLTLVLVVGVLALQFRKARAFLLLLGPLAVGTIWSLGVFALVSPTLNVISSAVLIVLAGLGIDFGLHLITHFGSERERGLAAPDALLSTLSHLLSSLWVAGLTTSCGFLALTAGRFRGFAQMGLLAAIGIACILVATLLVIPPLILWLDRHRPLTASLTRPWTPPASVIGRWRRGPALAVTLLGLAGLGAGVWQTRNLELEYDFKPLVTQAAGDHGTHFGPALHGTSRSVVLMLADDPAALEAAGRGVRERYPDGLRGVEGASVITPGTFVPPDPEGRLASIARLRELARDAQRHAKGALARRLEAWQPLLEVTEPVRAAEMPQWVLDGFSERDGTFGKVGVIYHSYASENARHMIELTGKLEELRARFPGVRFASHSAVLGEVVPLLAADGLLVTGLALAGLLISTLLVGRSLRRTLLVATAVCMAVATSIACMVALSWKVNLYNLLVFPVAFGIGVDGAIYVVWSVYRRRGVTDWSGLPVSSRAVIGSTLTTLVAFGSLITSQNGGLASLGKLASVALALTLVINLVWLPAVLSLRRG
jgi:uncharacterized protein